MPFYPLTKALKTGIRRILWSVNELDAIESIADVFGRTHLTLLDVQVGESHLRLRRRALPAVSFPLLVADFPLTEKDAVAQSVEGIAVEALLVGVFRNLPNPPREGVAVRERQVLGKIEALGIQSDCVAPVAGKITRVVIEDGQAVEYGQMLFEIQPESVT